MVPNPQQRQAAERQLHEWANMVDQQAGLCHALLEISTTNSVQDATRHAAAIYFKNLVKGHWDEARHDHVIMVGDKAFVKSNILDVMLQSPEYIRKTLGEAVMVICEVDFPSRWPDLVPNIAQKLSSSNLQVIQGALTTAHAIFSRYQKQECLNEQLVEELTAVNKSIAMPLLNVLEESQRQSSLLVAKLCVDVFYDLCYLDFGVEVESSLERWMNCFLTLIQINVSNDQEAWADLKGSIIRTLALFLTKYDEDFTPYLEAFCQAVWGVLQKVTENPIEDSVSIGAMDFLAAAMKGIHYKLFIDPQMQRTICEYIIVPNILLRESDVEMFEDDTGEYIQRDIEGSDVHTRRRAASELGQALLSEHFNNEGFQLLSRTVENMFQQALANPGQNWRQMDGALHMMMSLSTQAGMGALHATTNIRQLCDLKEVFARYVLPDLKDPKVVHPILKADNIKFVCCFRMQIPKSALVELLPSLSNWIKHDNDVIVTYTAHAIDRLIHNKENGMRRQDLQPVAVPLVQSLMKSLANLQQPNERVSRALFRVVRTVEDAIDSIVGDLLGLLNRQIVELAKNPTNPSYSHYIFETISSVVSANHQRHLAGMEQALWQTFMNILSADVQDFMPYIFQIIAQFVTYQKQPLSTVYVNFFSPLVTPHLYSNKRSVPSLVRLLSAYIAKCAKELHQGGHTEAILNVFKMLILSKATDQEGFVLLSAMTEAYPPATMTVYLPNIIQLFFGRLTNSKTTKFVRCLILYLSLFVVTIDKGAQILLQACENTQRGIFRNLFENVWLRDVGKVVGGSERKLCVVALSRFVTQCDEMQQQGSQYGDLWARAVFTICRVLHCGHDKEETPSAAGDGGGGPDGAVSGSGGGGFFGGGDDSAAVGSGNLLSYVTAPKDPLPQVGDAWAHFTRELGSLLQCPQASRYVSELKKMPPEAYSTLKEVFPQL